MVRPAAHRVDVPVRAVLFDMDDTLFDHTFSLRTGLAAAWRTDPALRTRPFGAVVREYERLLDDIHPDVLQGRKSHAEARAERFRRLFEWAGSPRSPTELTALSHTYREAYQAARRPVDGALPLLRSLHGRVTVGVVSNNHTAEQREKVDAIGIARFLDFLLTSEDAGAEKPNPAIFRTALARANSSPAETVMVGDSWPADIVGARALGIRSVWLNRRRMARPESAPEVREVQSLRPVRSLRAHLLAPDVSPSSRNSRREPGL
ncbi:MAG: HAD family hydrolase [Thermoplasmata archaeon]|nr:HAD family hydrolase [Thermoplasmata archaeon]